MWPLLLLLPLGACGNKSAAETLSECGLPQKMRRLLLPVGSELSIEVDGGKPVEFSVSASLTNAADPPVLTISLAREEHIAAGTYPVTVADADPLGCTLCATIVGPIDTEKRRPSYTYAASAGTLEVQAIDGRLRGVLKDATFREVRYDPTAKRYLPGGECESKVASIRFDLPRGQLTAQN